MSKTQKLIEKLVSETLYENTDPTISGMGNLVYTVKLSHLVGSNEETRTVAVRSATPEGAKTLALMIASKEGLQNPSVVSIIKNPPLS